MGRGKGKESILDKGWEFVAQPVPWVVKSQSLVQAVDLLDLFVGQGKGLFDLQVLEETFLLGGLWNDGDTTLGGPLQQDVGWGDVVFLSDGLDGVVFEQSLCVQGLFVVQLDKG